MKSIKTLMITMSLTLGLQALADTASIGQPAPDFSLKDSNGKIVKLSDFKNKTVVLEWLNHDCPYVKKHYGSNNMQTLQKEVTGKQVIWLSIVSSGPGKQGHYPPKKINALTLEKNAQPSHVLVDADGKVGKLYGAKTTPHMFVIHPQGNLVYAGAIDSIASTDADDIAQSKNYIREAVNEVLAGKAVSMASSQPYGCSVKYD